jgi:hypothetical protein
MCKKLRKVLKNLFNEIAWEIALNLDKKIKNNSRISLNRLSNRELLELFKKNVKLKNKFELKFIFIERISHLF